MDFKAIIDMIVNDPGVLDVETLKQLRMDVTVAKNQVLVVPLEQDYLRQVMSAKDFREVFIGEVQVTKILEAETFYLPLFYLQFLCNFASAARGNRDIVLDALGEPRYRVLAEFYSSHADDRVNKCCWVFAFNVLKNSSNCQYLLFEHQFVSPLVRGLFAQPNRNLEWATYLACEVFANHQKIGQSFYKHIISQSPDVYYLLFHLAQKTIDDRQCASLIQGIEPEIRDISDLYDRNQSKLGIRFSIHDLQYILEEFQVASQQLIESGKAGLLDGANVESISKLLKLLSLITFVGGFNRQLQGLLMGTFRQALDSFVVIRELYNELGKQLEVSVYEDLVSIYLRFLGNMIHINREAQELVLSKHEYLRTVLGFTGYDTRQSQMREWSMVLVRNLSEGNLQFKEKVEQYLGTK